MMSHPASSSSNKAKATASLGPLSRIYADYENEQRAKRALTHVRGGGGRKKKQRSSSSDRSKKPMVLKERPVNIIMRGDFAPSDKVVRKQRRSTTVHQNQNRCNHPGCTAMSYNNGLCQTHNIAIPPTPCNFQDGCSDMSVRDGLCKSHWCAVNLCTHEKCFKMAAAGSGLCRDHRYMLSMRTDDDGLINDDDGKPDSVEVEEELLQEKKVEMIETVDKVVVTREDEDGAKCSSVEELPTMKKVGYDDDVKSCFQKKSYVTEEEYTNRSSVRNVPRASLDPSDTSSSSRKQPLAVDDNSPAIAMRSVSTSSTTSSGLKAGVTYQRNNDLPHVVARSVSTSSTGISSLDAAAAAPPATSADASSGPVSESNNPSYASSLQGGCTCGVVKGVRCARHTKSKKPCSIKGCTNRSTVGGVCIKHGAKVKRCSHDGCNNIAQKRGLCRRHGAASERGGVQGQEKTTWEKCSLLLCTSAAVEGGVCLRHRALSSLDKKDDSTTSSKEAECAVSRSGRKVKLCKFTGCANRSIQGGVCFRHGAKAYRMRCTGGEGCKNYVVRGGLCIKHGANELVSKKSSPGKVEEEKEEEDTSHVQSLTHEGENNNSSVDVEVKKNVSEEKTTGREDLFKSIDQLEDSCADILLLLRKDC